MEDVDFEELAERLGWTGRKAPMNVISADQKFPRDAPLVVSFVGGAVILSAVRLVRHLRAAVNHPLRAARGFLIADLVLDFSMAMWAIGRESGRKLGETPEQTMARLDVQKPLKPWRIALGARTGLVSGLIASQRRSPGRSVVSGVLGYAFSLGLMAASRALHPRVRAFVREAAEAKKRA